MDKKKIKIKPPIKIIQDRGPKYRYIINIYRIPKNLKANTPFNYILDYVDNFSKFMNTYLLKINPLLLLLQK